MKLIVTRKKITGRWYVRIVAGNGETVATTEHYSSRGNAMRAAQMLYDAARNESWMIVG